jgi:hypothetical protein
MPNQRLKAKPNRVRVCRSTARLLRFIEKLIVDIQRLLHMGIYTISVWLFWLGGMLKL